MDSSESPNSQPWQSLNLPLETPIATVLIVEDSESDRLTYSRYLRSDSENSYRIIEAGNLEEGLELWRSQQPDIVLTDLNLPDGDGFEFLEAINLDRTREKTPVIMLTGRGNEERAVRSMKLGATDYLVKGDITAKSFTSTIRQVFQQTLLMRQLRRSEQQQILTSEIALRIREFLNLEDISNAIVREVRQFINADRAIIYQFNPDMSGTVVAEDIVSPWQSCLKAQVEDTCFRENLGGAYAEGKFFAAHDIYRAGLTDCHIKLLERFQVRANLVVPILLPNANKHILWGLLIMHQCSAPRVWEESDIQLLQRLSVKLAISIQQAIAFEQVQSELTERRRVESLLLSQQKELEERNNLLERVSADLECSVEELRITTEEQIIQHRQLEYEQYRHQNLFEFAPDGYLVTDLSGKISEVNQVALELLAIRRDYILGKPLDLFVALDNRDFFDRQFHHCLSSTNAKTTWEITLKKCQGEFFPAEISVIQNINPMNSQPQLFWLIRNISDRKRAEQELLELNQSLETKVKERTQAIQLQSQMLEQIHDAVISATIDGTILTWNVGAERLYEYKAHEAIGLNVGMLYLNEDLAIMEPTVFRPLLEKGTHEVELRNQTKSGKIIYIRLRLSIIWDALGNPIRLIGCSNDISDRKLAEESLRESEKRFANLAAAAPVAIFQINQKNECTYVNGFWSQLTGQEPSVALGYGWLQTIHPDDREQLYQQWTQAIKQQVYYQGEGRCLKPDGTICYFYCQAMPELNEDGIFTGYIGTLTDISDRKQAELRLQHTTDRLALALKSGAIGCWEWGVQDNIAFWDDRMYELYGVSKETTPQFSYEMWIAALHPDDRVASEITTQQITSGQIDEYDTEFRVVHPDGSIHFIKAYGTLKRDVDGNPQSIIGINFDISDRKQAELQLQTANQELLRATRLKDEFLANMSHELRTPLNAILGFSETLQDEVFGSLNEKQLRAISIVESSGKHLLSLINDILDLSKMSSGMMVLDIEPVSVQNLCDSSLTFVNQQAFQKRVHLHSNIPPLIKSINIDERRIKQVLINLLTNAVKFTPHDGAISLLVAVGSGNEWEGEAKIPQRIISMNSPMIVFQVIDNGIGIADKDLRQIFQPFVQVDSALNREYEGTGLGLALVKQIVELHGGQIMVESEIGQGSCFTVALPYEMPPSNAIAAAPSSTTLSSQDVDLDNPPLILLAEDNEANIQTFCFYLTAINYRVILARNGVEAVAQAKANLPDIILMDIQMPTMDGLEATKQIRLDPNLINTPIIALTALAMEGDRDRCLEAGMNGYISKPLKLKQLAKQIADLLAIAT
ncbi:PAS domain S-box protein [Pseudanabaena sp. 'Roaring Creek']|uniref:PAS domain S-box protein n=1 Tax=Pseudanabaena sp. 'Roaring Creek' TaxID=1681830 RepID=UPI0018D11507|nr:PAS domain S-box protein [Pseudanabaena sp. 'Roaring Creek']